MANSYMEIEFDVNYSFARYYKASSTLGFQCIVYLGYINVET